MVVKGPMLQQDLQWMPRFVLHARSRCCVGDRLLIVEHPVFVSESQPVPHETQPKVSDSRIAENVCERDGQMTLRVLAVDREYMSSR